MVFGAGWLMLGLVDENTENWPFPDEVSDLRKNPVSMLGGWRTGIEAGGKTSLDLWSHTERTRETWWRLLIGLSGGARGDSCRCELDELES
jgi:hypothetical protein